MRIFGDSISGNCLKVKWTADHLRLSYDWIETDVLKAATRTPEFLALNPAGQVPAVILDDGRPLAQSNAIILHLAEGSALIPADPYDRARMLEWMFWEQYSHEPYVAVARFQVRFQGKAVADLEPRIVERGKAALQRLEDGLAASPFLVDGGGQSRRRRPGGLHPRGRRRRLPPGRLSEGAGLDRPGGEGLGYHLGRLATFR
ncbi:glutathione S-transferase family protein [Phenylobacterium sp.]|uniref:glutathione S-transferase family protein n=1 Tax=Phenylobacterium sp. TaxID=1871053 RepID=UPI00273570D3|nr:glutathione S-transferase N-terminal domain-containing protein [Phenylobacterium sp.]MDP3634568.1 glutathione S-transferase N-terminal domain-containing protein [Phenylobacterium sp.]